MKIVYNREESFFGHVHRHPARICATSTAPTRDGRLVYVRARILLDGGAYASSSTGRRARNAGVASRSGRTRSPNALIDAYVRLHEQPAVRRDARLRRRADAASRTRRRWTSSPPRSSIDPVELRLLNALEPGRHAADRAA